MAARVTYMNIPAVRAEKEESFEERRVIDYIHAYQTTGRPPAPCPPTPTEPHVRAAMGLPPMFEPHSEIESAVNGLKTPTSSLPNLGQQIFTPTRTEEYGSDAHIQTIVAQREYEKYSVEELRVEAYRLMKESVDVPPVAGQPVSRPPLLPSISISSTLSSSGQPRPDSLQSINSMPPYDQHSFEELRLAYLRAGQPLTSAEIIAQNSILRLSA